MINSIMLLVFNGPGKMWMLECGIIFQFSG